MLDDSNNGNSGTEAHKEHKQEKREGGEEVLLIRKRDSERDPCLFMFLIELIF